MKKFNRIFGTAAATAALLFSLTILSCSAASDGPSVIAFPPLPTPPTTPEQTQNGGVSYSPEALATPLTLEAAIDGAVVTFDNKASGPVTYKVNGGTAQTIASGDSANITLAAVGDKVEFFGDNKAYATSSYINCSHIDCYKDCYVYGNIMSIITSEGFENATTLENGYTFASFFRNNTYIKNKSGADLLLPATTLAVSCYASMFNSSSLAAAPSLPATTLAESCYIGMFAGCKSLAAAPSLPATTLANSCYNLMFSDCKSLTTAPDLPAATLAESCYKSMFSGCTSLKAAPSLPATTLANGCYSSMFYNCTRLAAAPELKATTLKEYCYYNMFASCTSLASVTCLATNISEDNCTKDWLKNVAANGTFTKAASMTSWTRGADGIPSGWTVVDK